MRAKATLSSFILVLVLYFVYGWGLVPLVLPNPSGGISGTRISIAGDATRIEIEPFIDLLPPDEWERDPGREIYMLRFGQVIVLFEKDIIDGRLLKLEPCTILVLPEGADYRVDEVSKEQIRQSIVLRAPQIAELEFDRDFEIGSLQLPNILACRLHGPVTIWSDMQDPGKHDDLFLETKDVKITENLTRIEAMRNVLFRLGFHSGSGNNLVLELAQPDPSQPQTASGLKSASFRTLQFLRLVFPDDPNTPAELSGDLFVPDGPATTIDVRCQGRFAFLANPAEQGWTASFFQNVEIEQQNSDKTIDRLTADEAYLTLTQAPKAGSNATAGGTQSLFGGLAPTLFVARGKAGQGSQAAVPARLSIAQNGGITLVGDEIFVDLRTKFLKLSTRQGTGASPHVEMILADQYKIRSVHTVQYTLGQNGAFGRFVSEGSGDLIGKFGEGVAAKDVYLTWNEMQITPHPAASDQIVLKLSQGITARMTGFGTMKADSLDLFCNVIPANQSASSLPHAGHQKLNVLLDHAIVKENVQFETDEGTCLVRQLTIFFTNIAADGRELHSRWMPQILTAKPPVAPPIVSNSPTLASVQPIQQVQHLQPPASQSLTQMQPLQLYPPAVATPTPAYGRPMSTPLPQSSRPAVGSVETQNLLGITSSPSGGKFKMTSDQMRMQVYIQNGQSFAERVAFEGNVHLKEITADHLAGTSAGIEIAGETVTIWNPADPTTKISILGHPTGGDAIFKGKGVELYARELNISRPDNKFWSPGPGRLLVHAAQINTPGIPSSNTDHQIRVTWNKEMGFDGQILQFVGQSGTSDRVKTKYQTQMLWCNTMEISLNRRVMFFHDPSPVEPEAVEIRCSGDVDMRSEQFDVHGKQKSITTAKCTYLRYDIEKNYFDAIGPGELNSIFLGAGRGFERAQQPVNRGNGENLNFLGVWRWNTMRGTLLENNRKVDIRGKVVAVYAPVTGWNDVIAHANIDAARRTGYILDCEQLLIVEVPDPLNLSQSSMELTASTNARIDGSGIFGRARTIMYNQAKSTVQLEGNIHLQTTTQGQRVTHPSAELIRYNVETNAIDVMQTQGLGIGQ